MFFFYILIRNSPKKERGLLYKNLCKIFKTIGRIISWSSDWISV